MGSIDPATRLEKSLLNSSASTPRNSSGPPMANPTRYSSVCRGIRATTPQ